MTLIYQGGYKVYDVVRDSHHVAIIGSLRPCIGIAVTDGIKLITVHKHSINALASMADIIRANLNLADSSNLFARIYSTRDDEEWQRNGRQQMHGGLTHRQAITTITDSLLALGFFPHTILATLYNLKKSNGHFKHSAEIYGHYRHVELYIAVRLNDLFQVIDGKKSINFFSIDPYTEYHLEGLGSLISVAEIKTVLPDLAAGLKNIKASHLAYDELSQVCANLAGDRQIGHKILCLICYKRFYEEESRLVMHHFGRELKYILTELSCKKKKFWDVIDFYPINEPQSQLGVLITPSKL